MVTGSLFIISSKVSASRFAPSIRSLHPPSNPVESALYFKKPCDMFLTASLKLSTISLVAWATWFSASTTCPTSSLEWIFIVVSKFPLDMAFETSTTCLSGLVKDFLNIIHIINMPNTILIIPTINEVYMVFCLIMARLFFPWVKISFTCF